jgi:elongation factor 1 alpha-like protein
MQSSLSKVQEVLGSSTDISEKEIKDALWNYYFDVDSSVAFLLGKEMFIVWTNYDVLLTGEIIDR